MFTFWKRFWRDDCGVISTTDLILLTTILGIGIIVGLVSLRNQVVQEFGDLGSAVGSLNQSYSYTGRTIDSYDGPPPISVGPHTVAGSSFTDQTNVGGVGNGGGIDVTPTDQHLNDNDTPGED